MNEELFTSYFVRAYLEKLARRSGFLTGVFRSHEGELVSWGAVAEYGDPPPEGLLVEMWVTNNPTDIATYRFWHAKESKNRYVRGPVIKRDELSGDPTTH